MAKNLSFTLPGTPEDLFIVHPDVPRNIDIAVLACIVKRARAVLLALQSDGENEGENSQGGFTMCHLEVVHCLWALEGYLDQIELLIRHASGLDRKEAQAKQGGQTNG